MRADASFTIATAPKRNSLHWKLGEVTWAEVCGWVESPSDRKEAGNYVMGSLLSPTTVIHKQGDDPCRNTHRRKDFVVSRSMLTLDVDHPDADFLSRLRTEYGGAYLVHTTYNSTPEERRYRLLIPADRDMAPDEYIVACRHLMGQLGVEQFDDSTDQPERYMFRPSAQRPEWFFSEVGEGEPLVVDTALADFEPDLSAKPMPAPHRNKRDPFDIEGVVGAFNRAYDDWDLLIATYDLPYEKQDDDRYHLVGARSVAGMGPIREARGLVFSHHVNDPAYGKTCSAFDLVRLHRFAELDHGANPKTPVNKLASHTAMLDVASIDYRVTAELVGVDFDDPVPDDPTDSDDRPTPASPRDAWRLGLKLAPRTGAFIDTVSNWDLVRDHDPVFSVLCFNEMSLAVEATADLPWRSVGDTSKVIGPVDRWEFCFYIERTYGFRPTENLINALINTRAQQVVVNPVRDYLQRLVWDRVPRVETCLPGVETTDYTRLVARKVMVAAVARAFDPGCKWDHTLVLYGSEGLGKSYWIDRVSLGYSDTLASISNKDTLLAMQRSWIMVSDEGHSLRKADQDALKEFLTRRQDVFRMPYDRETLPHPRHCVIWSTTNDETFLKRQEGNRRYLIVHCVGKVDFTRLTPGYIEQLWAEAVHLYRRGEPLFLADAESADAADERERYVEEDALAGVIDEFLNRRVPSDWWDRSPESRAQWFRDRDDGFAPEGVLRVDQTCSTQIWVEALGRRIGDHRRTDLLDITNALRRLPGWRAVPGRRRIPGYGPQMIYVRDTTTEGEDLL